MPPLVITQAQDQYRLGGHFEILQDHANTLSIEQLAADDRSDEFAPGIDGLMKFWTTGSVWVRFTISNRTDKDLDFTLVNASRPYLEGAARNLHWQQEDGTSEWTVRAANRSASGSQEVSHRHAIWHFSIERDETRTLVLNIAADGLATDINLSLWTPRAFDQHDRVAQIVLGLYYGIMLVMILYNLFLFLSLRDTAYLYYVLNIAAAGVFWAIENGTIQEYLGFQITGYLWGARTDHGFSFILPYFSWITLVWFAQVYLRLEANAPRLNRALWATAGIGIAAYVATLFTSGMISLLVMFLLNALFYPFILICGVVTWRRGYGPARYFVLGWSLGVVAVSVSLIAGLGLIDGLEQYQDDFIYLTQLGNVVEAVFFSLGLADRINVLRREKEEQEIAARDAERRSAETQEQSERKSAFLASMAHELRTPLNAIKGFNSLVLRRADDVLPDRQKDNLRKVDRTSDHLLAMINDLLDLSKIEAGRVDVNATTFDVRQVILSACDVVSPLVQKSVELRQEIPENIGEAYTDQQRLQQMLINLLSNAIKFTDGGSVTISAPRITAESRGKRKIW